MQFIIGIAGSYSDIGKTTFASLLIKSLKGRFPLLTIGAVKFTKTAIYCSISSEDGYLTEDNKDTMILKKSGADAVLWVQAPPHEAEATIKDAVQSLKHCDIIVIEGNTAVSYTTAHEVVFLKGGKHRKHKDSALALEHRASFVLDASEGRFLDKSAKEIIQKLKERVMKELIAKELKDKSKDGKITCALARKLAEDLKVSYKEVGEVANELKIKIKNCELGCF